MPRARESATAFTLLLDPVYIGAAKSGFSETTGHSIPSKTSSAYTEGVQASSAEGNSVKTWRLAIVLGCVLGMAGMASAQSVDAYFGLNALTASRSGNPDQPYLGGGTYLNVGGDLVFFHGLGFGAEAAWRASQMLFTTPPSGTLSGYQAPARPLFYDFNLVWEPVSLPWVTPVVEAGIGAASFRFYQPFYTCGYFSGCTNYSSSNHLLLHLGVAANIYLTDHIFIRPMADLYVIRHDYEFGSATARRFGVAIGYTLRATPF